MTFVSTASAESLNQTKFNKKRDAFFAERDALKKKIEDFDKQILSVKKEMVKR
jgi:hypothetical protein